MIIAAEILAAAIIGVAAVTVYAPRMKRRLLAKAQQPLTGREGLLAQLGTPARHRAEALAAKCAKTLAAYGDSDDLVVDGNRQALDALTRLHLKLLVAQREIVMLDVVKDAPSLQRQIDEAESSAASTASADLRESHAARVAILRRRLDNVTRRETLLTQLESDLARIEAQVDLALEDATLSASPAPVAHSIELASGLFDETLRPA